MLFKSISVGADVPLRWVQCLPASHREEASRQCHDDLTSGHQGHFKTFQRLRQNFYWRKMAEDAKGYVRRCEECQRQKSERRKPPGLMGSSPRVKRPFELLCSDLIGPLPSSSKGNTSLLVCVDFFSKFVFLKPLRDAKARVVCDFIENEIFLVYGCPRVMRVDNDPQYKSKEFVWLCARYNVEIGPNIRYTPPKNLTERYNQCVETMLRSRQPKDIGRTVARDSDCAAHRH